MSQTATPSPEVRTEAGALLSVVYASAATAPFAEDDLAALLARSRRSNRAAGVTGLLVHVAGRFMQVLEGPATSVRPLLTRIAADPRHSGVWVLAEERIDRRRFADWAMGYRAERDLARVPGFNGSILAADARDAPWTSESRASELLDRFRRR
ncbi:BLUF domain-containing protein [Amnibacterium sp.]|uniref:BLUF domain-containing protein n=1 Tax=Amnibacterium sp. TaxID=1872496 RepID=UPI0026208823|nr:BLUF domain-containing protein [Amnibacterium sp.]MCU1472267.1 hypothetical protein [Amnibacterium sp.]